MKAKLASYEVSKGKMKDTIAEELKHIVADKHKISEEFKKATAKIEELEASAQYSAQ